MQDGKKPRRKNDPEILGLELTNAGKAVGREHWKRWVESKLTRHDPGLWSTQEGPPPDPRPSQTDLPEALQIICFLFRSLFRSP